MQFYQLLEKLIGTEVELFENRNTGRLEIRPTSNDERAGSSGRFIYGVGEDYVTIEFRAVGVPHYDAYPFAQVTLRGWDSIILDDSVPRGKPDPRQKSEGPKPKTSRNQGSHDWLA